MYVGCKSKHLVNKRHTICCGLTSILWRAHISEGKYCPQQLVENLQSELGEMVSLMLRICRPIFGIGKYVVLDSGFCIAKGVTKLESKSAYAVDLIKKRHYFLKEFPGELIDNQFQDKEVGDIYMIEEITQENKPLKIFCMKYPDYVIIIMASWMTLDYLEGKKQ